ncbi:hypothetical protein QU593_02900 [Rossellomorea marisflavi]|uniref:hypothetical protein n=1 Tax=Rossellomorea marisflavi TaxID=189381 RepID=UPI001EE17FDC|nr:hypothetical protein [Rossellomorea marisflavi]UKS64882.1 hypothetical protein K6T23_19280 [Rossellomorea marisflavi]WJV19441.1 hypothetical protein QU593_02900 [Rossellomorea marisflavi]
MDKDELARKRWMAVPAHIREKLEGNVFCRTCGVTRIIDYIVDSADFKVLLIGTCAQCGGSVSRVID